MPAAKFLQISDLHLGAPLGGLPAERRAERRREQQRALEDAVRLAIERSADAILLAGDLFDAEGVDAETLAFAVHAFDAPGCPPVFIAPGNHDPYFPASPYWSPRLLEARGFAWPAHVHVFTEPTWSDYSLEGRRIRIWGRCFVPNVSSAARPLEAASLAQVTAAGEDELDVAIFHGAREHHCPPDQTVTAPFTDEEALRSPFAYLAVGHYHHPSRLERGASGVRLAYAGSAVALDPTELGRHGALEVRIEPGWGSHRVEIEPLPLDPRQVLEVAVDVSGASSADHVDRRIEQALAEAHATEDDIVTVRLSGRLIHGVRYGGPLPLLSGRTFQLRVDARAVRPDYDLDAYRASEPATTEERFARALLELLDQERDPEQHAVLERALLYGLDAFRLREVAPAYEELG